MFFLTSFFRTLPGSVAEAAEIDGASHSRIFFQVMLPMARPGLISVGVFNFLGQWNQYLLPLVLNNQDESRFVLPQGLARLAVSQGYKGDWVGALRRAGAGDAAGGGGVRGLPAAGAGRAHGRRAQVKIDSAFSAKVTA